LTKDNIIVAPHRSKSAWIWQVVLNNLEEHSFQEAVREWQKRWERCKSAEGNYFEGADGQ
jgi:uncharacterized protein (DUF1919 family)